MDLELPDISGHESTRRIRGTGIGKSIVIVALTGHGQKGHVLKAAESGFDHFFAKPADIEDIKRVLRA